MKAASFALILVAAGFAAPPVSAQPQKTREEVRAEAASAAKAGLIDHGEITRVPPAQSTKPRAEVKADTRAAVKAGAIDHGEVTTLPSVTATGKTRADVKAEAVSAVRPQPAPKPAAAASGK